MVASRRLFEMIKLPIIRIAAATAAVAAFSSVEALERYANGIGAKMCLEITTELSNDPRTMTRIYDWLSGYYTAFNESIPALDFHNVSDATDEIILQCKREPGEYFYEAAAAQMSTAIKNLKGGHR